MSRGGSLVAEQGAKSGYTVVDQAFVPDRKLIRHDKSNAAKVFAGGRTLSGIGAYAHPFAPVGWQRGDAGGPEQIGEKAFGFCGFECASVVPQVFILDWEDVGRAKPGCDVEFVHIR